MASTAAGGPTTSPQPPAPAGRRSRPTLVFVLRVETEHTVTRMLARPGYESESGEILYPRPRERWGPAAELADFQVYSYLERAGVGWNLISPQHAYAPLYIDIDDAERMVRVLRRLRRELDRLESF